MSDIAPGMDEPAEEIAARAVGEGPSAGASPGREFDEVELDGSGSPLDEDAVGAQDEGGELQIEIDRARGGL